jgi:hypothetical protein
MLNPEGKEREGESNGDKKKQQKNKCQRKSWRIASHYFCEGRENPFVTIFLDFSRSVHLARIALSLKMLEGL